MPTITASAGASATVPGIILETGQADRLEAVADAAMRRLPDLARRLIDEIARAQLVAMENLPPDVVALGRQITYRDEITHQEQSVVLVMPEEADIAQGRASVLTPIGVALIGLRLGASFTWETRNRESRWLTVTRVDQILKPKASLRRRRASVT